MSKRWLPDVSVWLALTLDGHIHHAPCMEWFKAVPSSDRIHFCRTTQSALLRLLTTSTVMNAYSRKPLSNGNAWETTQAWLALDRVTFAIEPTGLEDQWARYATRRSASPKLWMDAYLAAFAVTEGLHLITCDKAFLQFKGTDVQVVK